MTEKELRAKVVKVAKQWQGYKESNGSHKKIIDLYNSHKPLARQYTVKYTDAWCATFVSAVAIKAGMTDIIPTECGCGQYIELAKKAGIWVEKDFYVPKIGDIVLYDWDDNGLEDNTGHPDHIGIVVEVYGSTFKVIEGNMSNAVGYRNLVINNKFLRGFVTPDYAKKAEARKLFLKTDKPTKQAIKVGDTVKFTGCLHYTSSYANGVAKACKAGIAKVTSIAHGKAHPYHLQAIAGKDSTVYGWVNSEDVESNSK